jgi:inorganic pyrophosphatase
MNDNDEFWDYLDTLVKENEIIIDRPKGTKHPRYDHMVYEFDYGYIDGTKTTDSGGIDVFKGSLHSKNVNTFICTVDLFKKDVEIKILIGCTPMEKRKIYEFLNNSDKMKAILIERRHQISDLQKEIIPIDKKLNFNEIHVVFEDIVGNPGEENIKNILSDYVLTNEKTLYGYFLDKKLVGIMGIKENAENIEVLHFGIHPEYRDRHLGTELMDYIKKWNKVITLTTDDDAILFYKKCGFVYTEYYEEKYSKRRYNCIYRQ